MTTPPTPADWYPDPENPAGLRYWDGRAWTEHRAPAPAAGPMSGRQELAPEEPDGTPADAQPEPVQPYDTHPPTADEPPPEDVPWDAPMPAWDLPSTQQTSSTPPPTPSFEAPPSGQNAYEPAAFAPPPGPPPSHYGGGSNAGPNKKLVVGILGGGAAILLAIVVVIAVVVMRKDESTVMSSQPTPSVTSLTDTTSSQTTSENSTESSPTESPTPPPTGAEGSDGDYTFSVEGTETGDTITSTVSDSVETTADGLFYVVYVNVTNTGTAPLTFVATFQQLSAAGQTFPLDDQATAFLGGTIAEIGPGDTVETPLVYDIPVDTTPDSISLRADPVSPGVQLPLQ